MNYKKSIYILSVLISIIFNISSQASTFDVEISNWKCASPQSIFMDISIPSTDEENYELKILLKNEKKDISENSANQISIRSSYNNLYGKWAEKVSQNYFLEAGFQSYNGKFSGNHGFDGFYTISFKEGAVAVINEVKFNKSQLTRATCKSQSICKCGQMSRNWIENSVKNLSEHNPSLLNLIQTGNYFRTLTIVDTNANIFLYEIRDDYCINNSKCKELLKKEESFSPIIKNIFSKHLEDIRSQKSSYFEYEPFVFDGRVTYIPAIHNIKVEEKEDEEGNHVCTITDLGPKKKRFFKEDL